MIVVLGNDPAGVELQDLKDTVYYKQQKIYSVDQYDASEDLRRALKRGSLTLLEKSEDKNPEFEIPTFVPSATPPPVPRHIDPPSTPPTPTPPSTPPVKTEQDDALLKLLLEKITSLEGAIQAQQNKEPVNTNGEALQAIYDRIQKLEEKVSTAHAPQDSDVAEMLKNLAEKLEDSKKSNDPSDKLDSILSRLEKRLEGGEPSREMSSPGEIYVPSVSVEDANAHINLNVRTIEKSDSVNESLKALRALKKKQQ
ncbi:MAG: hypothetical protein GF334_13320 [Candidatus Altiarchaeales archaeon]|nr:hypothetical protein [Candidatus Altiarchaeales archaeon]